MPRSKRNKIVSLTKTQAKGREQKSKYVESIRSALDEFEHVYVFSYENMRAGAFKDVRMDWRDSRIFLGKNSISRIALGRSPEDEYKDNLRHVSERIDGNVGLLFTNRDKKETLDYFHGYVKAEFGKAGTVPNEDIILSPGPLQFPIAMIDQLRKLGLVVEADNGVLVLRERYVAAKNGVPLTPEQAKVLAHLDKPVDEFKLQVLCAWHDGEFEEL